ncbi:hemerythrin domain-containing protein [Achromobacter sp. NPDC058515]|uniref:hemerythrin domain-containing protein n=1 Tax=Achromobacter sp. NPDC058515 TaxID=3346533 RepID=UPI0036534E6C
MNIDKFKQQHVDILQGIASLRRLAQAGVARNAAGIAQGIVSISATIKLHLAVEDRALYPAVARSRDLDLARKGREFQEEMDAIAAAYEAFARRWNNARSLELDEEGFRVDANTVLRRVHERMQRENRDLYPRIEAM